MLPFSLLLRLVSCRESDTPAPPLPRTLLCEIAMTQRHQIADATYLPTKLSKIDAGRLGFPAELYPAILPTCPPEFARCERTGISYQDRRKSFEGLTLRPWQRES